MKDYPVGSYSYDLKEDVVTIIERHFKEMLDEIVDQFGNGFVDSQIAEAREQLFKSVYLANSATRRTFDNGIYR